MILHSTIKCDRVSFDLLTSVVQKCHRRNEMLCLGFYILEEVLNDEHLKYKN